MNGAPSTETLGDALGAMAAGRPDGTAIEVGGEAPILYRDLLDEARAVAESLTRAGLRPGQGVLLATRARARVPAMLHGALLAGGVGVSIEPTIPPVQLRSLAERAHTALALGDPDLLESLAPRRLDPLYPTRPQDPHLGLIGDPPPIVPPLDGPGHERAPGDRPALVIFTSGSTGAPKGVLLSHASLLSAARRLAEARAHHAGDRHLSYLSFSHLAELFMSVVLPLATGYTVVFPRGRRLTEAIAAVRPTFLMGVPLQWQTLAQAAAELTGSPAERRATLGLDRVRLALSTGAALAAEAHAALVELGVPVHEMYGMTETTGAVTYNAPGHARPRSVGVALPGSRVEIDEVGEVLLYGAAHRCLGYLDDVEGTNRLFVPDGGVRTGDLGSLDESGYLYITGRKKDLLILSSGKKIHPSSIEARLSSLPGVRHAVVFGEGHPHLVAILDAAPDPRLRTPQMSLPELAEHLVTQLAGLNDELARHERIVVVGIAPQPFSVQSAELTPSLKVRREIVHTRHKHLVERLLTERPAADKTGIIVRFDES